MEGLEKKIINGNPYYYYTKWGRVNGKSKRIWQKYLGKPEDIFNAVVGGGAPAPQYVELFQFGLPTALIKECFDADVIAHVNNSFQKRNQGLTVGEYIAIAAINRAIHPVSKNSIFEWFSKTTLIKYFPNASRSTLSSKRFWDNMDLIRQKKDLLIWKNVIKNVIKRENLNLSSVCYDGTNFYTFIDTFNYKCDIAKRGKNKQGRSNLRQISYALFCSTSDQIPLFYNVYDGNRNDTKQFPLMIQSFHDFLKDCFGQNTQKPQITIIFDKGNNSSDNFDIIDNFELHYVGSVKLCEATELVEKSNQDPIFTMCQTIGLESTKSFRTKRKIYAKERVIIVTYNQKLFNSQLLTLHKDIENSIGKLENIQQKLLDRSNGLIKGGQCPTLDSIEKQCKNALSRQHMTNVIKYTVDKDEDNIPKLKYDIISKNIDKLSDTYLGKNILVTDSLPDTFLLDFLLKICL